VWSFTTKTNNPPNIPFNPHPSNGETNVATTTDLTWSGGDPDGDDVAYDVYFGIDNNPDKVAANQTATTYDPGTMNTNTTYYWKIVAWDEHGEKATGPFWEFTTIEQFNNPPNTPSIWGSGSFIPGVEIVQPNVEYNFTVVTSDSDGDDVHYWVDWGDNTNTGWLGPYSTSIEQTVSHTWTQPLSLKLVKVKAKDVHGAESGWGYLVIVVNQHITVLRNVRGVTMHGTTQQQSQPISGQGATSAPSFSPLILRTIQTKTTSR